MRHKILVSLLTLSLCAPFVSAGASQKPQGKQRTGQKPATSTRQPDKTTAPAEAAKPAAAPAQPKRVAADQWALLIGISQYPGQIQSLQFPRSDARAIKDLLVSAAGFPEDHVKLLTDDGAGDAKATKQNIFAAIDQYLAPRVEAGHQVIVFLAGHGITRGLGAQAKSFFLPVDVNAATKESLESTAIDLADLAARLGTLKASQFTIFMDACREDPFPGRGIKGNTMTDVMARGLTIVRKEEQAQATPPTAIVFYACQVGERAYEDPKLEHGVFTYFILKGIKDIAANPDGRVEAGQLASYLRENVRGWSEEFQQRAKFPVEQTPTMTAVEVRGPMVVVRMAEASPKPPSPPTVGTLSLFTSPKDASVSLNGQQLGTAPIEKELAPGTYTIKAELSGFQPTEAKVTIVAGYNQEFTLTLKPAASNASYDKGVQFESQKLWPQAIASYEQAIKQDASLMAAYERLAGAYLATGRYRDAIDLLGTASEKFPDNATLIARRARALSLWAGIEETQDQSMNPRPDKAVKWKDARKEAVKAAELAAQKAPDSEVAQLALGYAYGLDDKSYQKALNSFVKASTIAPEDAEGYFGVGWTYRLMKQYEQAVPQLKKAIELRPDYYEAHRELAYCNHAMGNTDEAIKEYNTATGYRGETNNSGEMAGNHLALSALYVEKGQEVGGEDGKAIAAAGKGHETEAREYDPTLKAALKILTSSGVAFRMQSYLPSELRNLINDKSVDLPGGVKIPFPKKRFP
ncbi:MAG TPA: caspase family protein [Blastocatellia bacterium]|nr:caspase family protein [Blastocatellia bacterium]